MAQVKVTVKSRVVLFANRIVSIPNISEASLWKDRGYIKRKVKLSVAGVAIIAVSILLWEPLRQLHPAAGAGGIALGVVMLMYAFRIRAEYELLLQTNSGRIVPLASKDRNTMQKIIDEIHDSMMHLDGNKDTTIYVQGHVINSQLGSSVGGNVNNSIR
jgi:hypothetical protein